jgi:predicted dehydrogenase
MRSLVQQKKRFFSDFGQVRLEKPHTSLQTSAKWPGIRRKGRLLWESGNTTHGCVKVIWKICSKKLNGSSLRKDIKSKGELIMNRVVPLLTLAILFLTTPDAQTEERVIRLGMIGLDTSHVIAFTKLINDPEKNYGCRVVVGYSGGSPDIPSSINRVEGYTKQLREQFGVEIVDSIEELCDKVDGVLLESVDGRPHLKQAKPVIAARKPLFIDKPMAGNLPDVIEIFRLAKENKVPCWSSSSLRFGPSIAGMRNSEKVGDVLGCAAFSPCSLEEHHPDLYWYGVHGVEILFTIMGPGCESVRRVQTKDTEFVVGTWKDGRVGTYRGLRKGKRDYGALVYGTKGIARSGGYEGYGHLIDEVIEFFKTGKAPVAPAETIEIFAFMSAADESKARGGAEVSIASIIEKAKKHNELRRSGKGMSQR